MAKRGEKQPWKVRYQWENGIKGTIACSTQDVAKMQAERIRLAGHHRGLAVVVTVEATPDTPNGRWVHVPGIDLAQAEVECTRERYQLALGARADAVRRARDAGATIYAIAKQLGVSQNAVRRMLNL